MEDVSLSVNGQSRVPPGFRFHPTEEELLHYYLRKKVAYEKIDLDVIRDIDLNKLEPWDIQERCKIGSTPQNDWYFFSHKDKKYPTGTRTNRATAAGFWKATGRDKVIYTSFKRIGMRKTLVFYKGRAPHGQKSDWIMHEYRLDDNTDATSQSNASSSVGESAQEEGWVVCRVFKKKNYHKTIDSPKNSSVNSDSHAQMFSSSGDGALDQILQYMGRMCKQEAERNKTSFNSTSLNGFNNTSSTYSNISRCLRPIETHFGGGIQERFMQLPALDSPTVPALSGGNQSCYSPVDVPAMAAGTEASAADQSGTINMNPAYQVEPGMSDLATLDRLLAAQFNGQGETSCFNDPNLNFCSTQDQDLPLLHCLRSRSFASTQDYSDNDLWNFGRSSSL